MTASYQRGAAKSQTMKHFLILRHAKSNWNVAYEGDHERPLSPRGIRDAGRIGKWLQTVGEAPQQVLSSSAVRAKRTVELAAKAGEWDCPVQVHQELYDAAVGTILSHVRQQDDSISTLLFAGHQPTVSDLVEVLIGGGCVDFPTACVARIDLDIPTWRQAVPGTGVLAWLVTPKMLPKSKGSKKSS